MAQIDKVQVQSTTYDIAQSSSATFSGTSNDSSSPSAWTSVPVLTSGETNGSIFTKISKMFSNIRWLYNQLGTTDYSAAGSTVSAALASLQTNKAAASHSHTVADLPVSSTQVNSSSYIPTSDLVYNMNTAIGTISDSLSSHTSNKSNPHGVTASQVGAAAASHTHSYAGSSSAGGSATSAVKLDTTTAGSATQPCYFASGKPSACSYSLNKTVPSNAVFTDTTYSTATTSAAGLLRALNGSTSNFLRGDGTWQTPPNTTYSTATTSAAGLLRALNGSTANFLRGDGSWATPSNTTYSAGTALSLSGTTFNVKTSSTQTNSSSYVPTSSLVYSMNTTLSSLSAKYPTSMKLWYLSSADEVPSDVSYGIGFLQADPNVYITFAVGGVCFQIRMSGTCVYMRHNWFGGTGAYLDWHQIYY